MKYAKQMLLLFLSLLWLFCGCTNRAEESRPTVETTVPTDAPTQAATEPVTEPTESHSKLYIPGVSVEDVILYFNEVCLDAEFINGGDATLLQKWTEPIPYIVLGEYTSEDYITLTHFAQWLNTIEGFPGIYETRDPGLADLEIHFCTYDEMIRLMGEQYAGLDGAVTFWYLDNEIYDGTICCRTELNQHLRNSVIIEEVYNGLGPVQDTSLRPDSIIYAEYSEPQELTEVDKLILKLLYHPDLVCGMNAAECEAVIRSLYY